MATSAARLVPPLLMLALLACGGEPPRAAVRSAVDAGCASRPGGSRWAGDYAVSATFGAVDPQAIQGGTVAGIATAGGTVYVMESGRARLWVLRADLSVVRAVGREGSGPGEWWPFGPAQQGGSMGWVNATTDGVRLFDGERIQEFSPDDGFRRVILNTAMLEGVSPLQSRIRYVGDTLVYSGGGYDFLGAVAEGEAAPGRTGTVNGRSIWWIRARDGERVRPLLELALIPLRAGEGIGPAQALPLWDTDGRCVVASDGASPYVVAVGWGEGPPDTIPLALPDRRANAADYAADLADVLPPQARPGEPSVAARVRDLVLDPDGVVWILPVQPKPRIPNGVEVIQMSLADGKRVLDTVPAFPRAFGAPGIYYAEVRDEDGAVRVVRLDREDGTGRELRRKRFPRSSRSRCCRERAGRPWSTGYATSIGRCRKTSIDRTGTASRCTPRAPPTRSSSGAGLHLEPYGRVVDA